MSTSRALLLFFAASLACAQTGAVHGIVKDEATGQPLPGLTVQSTGRTKAVDTDPQGRYAIAEVPAGAIEIIAHDSRHPRVARKVQLQPNEDLEVDFLIPPNAMVSGRVLNQDKEPVADTQVWAVQTIYSDGVLRHSLLGPRVTGKDGRYTFDDLLDPGRKYYLVADRKVPDKLVSAEPKPLDQREPIELPTYYGDVTTLDAASPVLLHPGEQREGMDIRIRKAAYYCVDGAVEIFGKPASVLFNVHELALAGTSLMRLNEISKDDGSFRVCGLPPGQYLLSTNNPKGASGAVDFTVGDSDVHRVSLSVDTASLHLQVGWQGDPPPEPAMKLAEPPSFGRQINSEAFAVRLADGRIQPMSFEEFQKINLAQAARKISVQLSGMVNPTRLTQTVSPPADGPYATDIPAGDYAVDIGASATCCYVKEMAFNGVPFSDAKLHLAPGTSGTLHILVSADGGTLRCKAPDATIVLMREGATGNPQIMPSPANWQNLPPGKFHVLAVNRPLHFPEDLDKVLAAFSQGKEVEISARAALDITLDPISID